MNTEAVALRSLEAFLLNRGYTRQELLAYTINHIIKENSHAPVQFQPRP